ncbi:MAG: PCRF domain-containing protein, partial [Acidimicrobiaceae bacterium]
MKDFSSDLADLRRRIGEAAQYLNIETSRGLLVELEGEVAKPDLWNDQEHAKKINSQYAALKADIDQFNLLSATVDDLFVLHELARAEDDATQEPELERGIAACRSQLDSLEMRSMFT